MTTEENILMFAQTTFGKKGIAEIALKLGEEAGEVQGEVIRLTEGREHTLDKLIDELGDTMIVLSQLAAMAGVSLANVRARRYVEIRARAAKAKEEKEKRERGETNPITEGQVIPPEEEPEEATSVSHSKINDGSPIDGGMLDSIEDYEPEETPEIVASFREDFKPREEPTKTEPLVPPTYYFCLEPGGVGEDGEDGVQLMVTTDPDDWDGGGQPPYEDIEDVIDMLPIGLGEGLDSLGFAAESLLCLEKVKPELYGRTLLDIRKILTGIGWVPIEC